MYGALEQAFAAYLPTLVIGYPPDQCWDYPALADYVCARLPASPFIIIAESFAGPLALLMAQRSNNNLRALVLCATFVRNPYPFISRVLRPLLCDRLFRIKPNKWLIRLMIAGTDAPVALIERTLANLAQVSTAVLRQRLDAVLDCDARAWLQHCKLPLLHIHARRDHLLPRRSAREMQRLRPDMLSIEIDSPHFVLQRQSGECTQHIIAFLKIHHLV
jgi:pimeloyl-ACP methyl ester carboxylesterase